MNNSNMAKIQLNGDPYEINARTNLNELLQIEGINKELAKTIIRKINNE